MKAGDYSRARKSTGGVAPIVDMINFYMQKKRQKEQGDQIYNMINDYKRRAAEAQANSTIPVQEQQTTQVETPIDLQRPNTPQAGVNNIMGNIMKMDTGVKGGQMIDPSKPNVQPTDFSLYNKSMAVPQTKTVTKQVYDPTTHERNLANIGNEFNIELLKNNFDAVDPNKINAASGLMQNILAGQKPERPQTMTVKNGDSIIEYDPTTKQFRTRYTNEKQIKPDKPTASLLRSGNGVDYYGYKENGQEVITRKDYAPKGTTVNMKIPPSEKWKDVSEAVGSLNSDTFFMDGKEVKATPEIKKALRNQAYYKAIGNLSGNAKKWYDEKIKGEWKRENISQVDFLKELDEAVTNDEIDLEAAQDLKDFSAWRPQLFENLGTQTTKKEIVNYTKPK